MNARELGAPPIPFGPYAISEAVATGQRLGAWIARRARGLISPAVHSSEATEEWIARLESRGVSR